jgi:hypothetical protein
MRRTEPIWMLNNHCRTDQRQQHTDHVSLKAEIIIVVHETPLRSTPSRVLGHPTIAAAIPTEASLSLETEPPHLFPKRCARDTEQGGSFADFAASLPDHLFNMQPFCALPRF